MPGSSHRHRKVFYSSEQNPPLLTQSRWTAGTRKACRHLTVPEKVIMAPFLYKGWSQSTKKAHPWWAGRGMWSLNVVWKNRKRKVGETKGQRSPTHWPRLQFRASHHCSVCLHVAAIWVSRNGLLGEKWQFFMYATKPRLKLLVYAMYRSPYKETYFFLSIWNRLFKRWVFFWQSFCFCVKV